MKRKRRQRMTAHREVEVERERLCLKGESVVGAWVSQVVGTLVAFFERWTTGKHSNYHE